MRSLPIAPGQSFAQWLLAFVHRHHALHGSVETSKMFLCGEEE
jgi:hypothetical protein